MSQLRYFGIPEMYLLAPFSDQLSPQIHSFCPHEASVSGKFTICGKKKIQLALLPTQSTCILLCSLEDYAGFLFCTYTNLVLPNFLSSCTEHPDSLPWHICLFTSYGQAARELPINSKGAIKNENLVSHL